MIEAIEERKKSRGNSSKHEGEQGGQEQEEAAERLKVKKKFRQRKAVDSTEADGKDNSAKVKKVLNKLL